MKTLFAAFGGITNSSKALLDCIACASEDKLYLKNSFRSAPAALREKLSSDAYDLVVLLGQRKMLRDKKTPQIATNKKAAQLTTNKKAAQPAANEDPSPTADKRSSLASTSVICLETVARNNRVAYHTEVNFPELAQRLAAAGLEPIISRDAGRYLCNNLYFETLKYVDEQPLKAKVIFIHIPKFRQQPDLPKIASALTTNLNEKILQNSDPL